MRKFLALLLAASVISWGSAAHAVQEAFVPCPELPVCQITCVRMEILTRVFASTSDPVLVDFMDAYGNILGTATFDALWGGQTVSNFDTPVDSTLVDSIRLTVGDTMGKISWLSLEAMCSPCGCEYCPVYKGCLCDWHKLPEAVILPVLEPEIELEPEVVIEVEREPEVIKVPGRG
jgi:hypothetical protein